MYRFLIKIIKKSNGFEARAGSETAEDRKSIDFSLKSLRKVTVFEAPSGSRTAGDRKRIDF